MNSEERKSLSAPIPFNKPFVAGKELFYIAQAVTMGNLGGDGHFTQACSRLLEQTFGIQKVLLTPSCTAALEMAAMLCRLEPGDEVIMPSYTFVTTASSFVREGATPVFVDIRSDTLNIDETLIEAAISPRTKAICVVHYAGVACEMDTIMAIAKKHNLLVVEDAAQGVNSSYKGKPLGSIGDLGCYSFHETKNFICGEGGALCINNPRFIETAEIIREKGTNRSRFIRGQVDKYTWVEIGSSYVPSELSSAFLYGQLELMQEISTQRQTIYNNYDCLIRPIADRLGLQLPSIPTECTSNSHMYYLICSDGPQRTKLLSHMRSRGIQAVFHYVPLHSAPASVKRGFNRTSLPKTDNLSERLIRLPMYFDISTSEQEQVVDTMKSFL
ncbi:dTDP-4-amino-4,6-dideoxygalactose transaminase [Rhodopirellula sp. P2]|uniref:dTDP-4-amino-4,6-dideoxygalactose transaminase n=1 Tax=Rhodopirellula sp. P2 TaxID=2127060 RepID=UPI002368EC54|nr:dTDP-4-amino-4,6-dideoxygalactose transaminase [Rhodopirellula sp. P2]WDQ15647.1 dTDP-4-amino-4,6-dideoxygalactose transaminase [Rhodopirellula sp. P2]